MIDDAIVIDGVGHAFNWVEDNWAMEGTGRYIEAYYELYELFYPMDKWGLDEQRFWDAADPDLLASALFAESQTDVVVYHDIPMFGLFKDGGSPLWVGEAMRERWPSRVHLFGGVSPVRGGALERVDELAEKSKVAGLKFYPVDLVDGEVRLNRFDDEDLMYPVLERARKHGIRHVAVHKAVPIGPVPRAPFDVDDLERAAIDFPDITFQVVHGGLAFLEETVSLLLRFPNVVVNLENVQMAILQAPGSVAQILGSFLSIGAEDRLLWAVGATGVHPRPLIEAFWDFQIPEAMQQGFGMPALTPEIKRKILGENTARLLEIDLDALRAEIGTDEFSRRDELADPWTRSSAGD